MTVEASWYDQRTRTLHVSCQVVPRRIVLTQPGARRRDAYVLRSATYERREGRRGWERG